MMKKFIVNWNNVEKIKQFSADVSKFESEIDVVSNRYTVDAKSIMGLFSLNLSKPVDVIFYSDDEFELEKFAVIMKNYEV